MTLKEPVMQVGLLEHTSTVHGAFSGAYDTESGRRFEGNFEVRNDGGTVVLTDSDGSSVRQKSELRCTATTGSTCLIRNIRIGREYHWERDEDQVFGGNMLFRCQPDGTLLTINEIPLEQYLMCVVSSEMSATAPLEFLKAHSVISRSWLCAMLERKSRSAGKTTPPHPTGGSSASEIVRWHDREDHTGYDVCADDHCQRYHGMTRISTGSVGEAIGATRGMVLMHEGSVCDARYSKSCGGRSENFENVWENSPVPYLVSIDDSPNKRPELQNEEDARRWILSRPEAYCNTDDESVLKALLPSFDQETKDFFRWTLRIPREELEHLIAGKSGIDFGTLMEIKPLERGPSGRIIRLQIHGTKRTVVVGKELEIRRWLSPSHLKSSAFIVETEQTKSKAPDSFTFHGAGWGHGVGLCQIGAGVMASHGADAVRILHHYYPGTELKTIYS